MIIVESYDRAKHGFVDDCDWVVTFMETNEEYVAEDIAAVLAVCNYRKYDNQYFCCHS